MKHDIWEGMYAEGWGDRIVPDAFSHPAKMSYNLLVRILAHAKEQGWISKGDLILDPFGGIGSTGICGAYAGYRVLCCELEEKFVDLANGFDCNGKVKWKWKRNLDPEWTKGKKRYIKERVIIQKARCGKSEAHEPHRVRGNFDLHRSNWETLGVPFPAIVQGDSRKLSEVLQGADCVVSSPPFIDPVALHRGSNLDRIADGGLPKMGMPDANQYGHTPGQLGAMKAGDLIISSPPYAESLKPETEDQTQRKQERIAKSKTLYDGRSPEIPSPGKASLGGGYGKTDGQLGSMPPGDLIVSSPPYEGSLNESKQGARQPEREENLGRPIAYGSGDNLGNSQGDTFWTAARQIVSECYKILKPEGHAVWIVKAFVRNKVIVDFPGDWQRLCEDVGFKTVCTHHAMLVKSHKVEHLFDGEVTKIRERKSFFRRLAEQHGSPKIDYECVVCMERP